MRRCTREAWLAIAAIRAPYVGFDDKQDLEPHPCSVSFAAPYRVELV